MDLYLDIPFVLTLYVLMFGLIIGSFLNVVVHRIPRMLEREWTGECCDLLDIEIIGPPENTFNLSYPASHCPKCGHNIRPWENIPVLSYILLWGRCSACANHISLRYPITELVCALCTLAVVDTFGLTWHTAAALLLTWSLLALSLIDYDTQLLPDNITIPLLWLGLLLSTIGTFTDPESSILGAIIGYMSLWSIFHLFHLVTGKVGMGYGDFKLFALFGAWFGWQSLPQIIILSSCVGALFGVFLIIVKKHKKDQPIPFGPYLALAGWCYLFWGSYINQLYLKWAGLI